MINLDVLTTFEVVDNVTGYCVYESVYLCDVIDFIGDDPNLYIKEKITSGYGNDVVEKDNAIMASIR